MNKDKHQDLDQQIKRVLDRSVEELDADTRYQLQLRRAKVLESQAKSNIWKNWPIFGGLATFASMATLATFLFISQTQLPSNDSHLSELDTGLFEADSNIELYEQYDFYVWLSEQESKG